MKFKPEYSTQQVAAIFRQSVRSREKQCMGYFTALEIIARDCGGLKGFYTFLDNTARGIWSEFFISFIQFECSRLSDPQMILISGKTRSEWLGLL